MHFVLFTNACVLGDIRYSHRIISELLSTEGLKSGVVTSGLLRGPPRTTEQEK